MTRLRNLHNQVAQDLLEAEFSMSLASMHERLGRSLEVGGKIHSREHTFDVNGTPLRDLILDCRPNRPSAQGEHEIALARESMGEDRWQQLNREFEA